ncbi:MAG: YggS family pyridoxal phosphate-dependent enzyme [Rhodoglobus sp.]
MDSDGSLIERLWRVRDTVSDAAREASRDPSGVTTIVVTKFHGVKLVRELFALGVRDFGESRHQEACPKITQLEDLDAVWHFIGQLQSNKARQVAAYSDVLHSFDRDALVDKLSDSGHSMRLREVFLQVNLSDDRERGGISPEKILTIAERVHDIKGLVLRGVMAVAPREVEPRAAFARVRALSEQLTELLPTASAISMGMSADYREAILEGATHLRIGAAITGKRPEAG